MENLAGWIWRKVEPVCPGLFRMTLHRDSAVEACSYFGPELHRVQHDRALVLFWSGPDSTTCLACALERFAHVETIAALGNSFKSLARSCYRFTRCRGSEDGNARC